MDQQLYLTIVSYNRKEVKQFSWSRSTISLKIQLKLNLNKEKVREISIYKYVSMRNYIDSDVV